MCAYKRIHVPVCLCESICTSLGTCTEPDSYVKSVATNTPAFENRLSPMVVSVKD